MGGGVYRPWHYTKRKTVWRAGGPEATVNSFLRGRGRGSLSGVGSTCVRLVGEGGVNKMGFHSACAGGGFDHSIFL